MAEYKVPDKEDYVSCPYNETHMVPYKTMQTHLIKCRRNHLHLDMETCPFNARHRIPRVELRHHQATCPNRVALQKEVIFAQRKDLDDGTFFSGDCTVPSYKTDHAAAMCSENWDYDMPENPHPFVFGVTPLGSNGNGSQLDDEWNNIPHSKQRSQADMRRPNTASLTLIGRGRGVNAAVKKPGAIEARAEGQHEKSTALLQSLARGRGVGPGNPGAVVRPGQGTPDVSVLPKQRKLEQANRPDTEKVTGVVRPKVTANAAAPPVVGGVGRGAQTVIPQARSIPRGVAHQIMISTNKRPGQNASIQTSFTAAKAQGRGRGITTLLDQSGTGFVVPNVNKAAPPEKPQAPSSQEVAMDFEDFDNGYTPPGRYQPPNSGTNGLDAGSGSQSSDDLDDGDNKQASIPRPVEVFEDFDNGYDPNVHINQPIGVLEDFENGYNPNANIRQPAADFDMRYNHPAKGYRHVEGLQNGYIPRSGRNQKPGQLDHVDNETNALPNPPDASEDIDEFPMPVASFSLTKGQATAASQKAKELRKLNKKLRAVEDLEKRRAGGGKLDPDQIEKLTHKDDILRTIETLSLA